MDVGHRFGRHLRAMRARAGLSQDALANAARLSRNYVGALERGEQLPSLDTMVRLGRALGVALPELVRFDDAATKETKADQLGRRLAAAARGASPRDLARFEKVMRAFFE